MARSELHKHAFWLYGIIVGLAVREALTGAVPPILDHLLHLKPPATAPPAGASLPVALISLRLWVFLSLVIRFYVGSALYFAETHEGADGEPSSSGYLSDFAAGTVHFILFYALALPVCLASLPVAGSLSPFSIILGIILLWDLAWWLLSRVSHSPGEARTRFWAFLNSLTVLVALLIIEFSGRWVSADRSEGYALIWVGLLSIVDLAGMILGKEYLKDSWTWFAGTPR